MDEFFEGCIIPVLVVVLIACLLLGFLALLGAGMETSEAFIDLVITYVVIFWGGIFLLGLLGFLIFIIMEYKWLRILFFVLSLLMIISGILHYQELINEFSLEEFDKESEQKNFLDILVDILWIKGLPFPIWVKIGFLVIFAIAIFCITQGSKEDQEEEKPSQGEVE